MFRNIMTFAALLENLHHVSANR